MKTATKLLATLAVLVSLQLTALNAAEISGKVTFKGTPPDEIPIVLDALCGRVQPDKITTRHYVVGEDGALADVFVYIKKGLEGKEFEVPEEKPMLDQVGCEYTPYVMGVMTNQKFRVKNSDPLLHNVHATPRNPGNKEFNFGQPIKGMVNEKSFSAPEVLVRIKCDVHPWMFAYVGVVDHPYYAVTDKKGEFKLPSDLPAGTYTIEAYHRKAGALTQEITVGADEKKTVDFTMEQKK